MSESMAARLDSATTIPFGLRLDGKQAQSWGPTLSVSATGQVTASGPEDAGKENERPPFPWRITPPPTPDYKGAARDTAYFMFYQLAVIGLLYIAPESVSGWTDEDKENYSFEKWKENVSDPQRDTDDYFINYVLHPYWGATYYVRGRERGFNKPQSFVFSAGLSFLFEFGFEAMFENPSYQDLWVTPVIGSIVGHFWFMPVRDRIMAKPGILTWQDKTILTLTDPLGVVSEATDRFLGIDTKVSVRPLDTQSALRVAGPSNVGAPARLPMLSKRAAPTWGLHVRMKW